MLSYQSFKVFFGQNKATAFLSEHVWEHLAYEEGILSARNCYDFLEDGGYIRVAVPDGNLRDEDFIDFVNPMDRPENHPCASHKILYTYDILSNVFKEVGFIISYLEYCDEQGDFHYRYWNPADGHIGRSFRYDTRNTSSKIVWPQ